MRNKKGFHLAALMLALVLCVGTCTAFAEEAGKEGLTFIPGYTFPSLVGLTGDARDEAAAQKNAYVLDEYAPAVKMKNGVKVQPVPADKYAFNTAIIKAEERGCNACHDLMSVVQLLPLSHPELKMFRNVESTIGDCLFCHKVGGGRVPMGESMHGLHLYSENFNGNCLSCHTITTADGSYELYDYKKYDIMFGITDVANVQGTFDWTQEVIAEVDDTFFWWNGIDERGLQPTYKGYDEDPEEFLNWEIEVKGDVENPGTFNLAELAAEKSVTRNYTIMCTVNQNGGSLIANLEVTGIPLSYIAEKYGMKEGVNDILPFAQDWPGRSGAVEYYMEGEAEGLLAYKFNGEYLRPEHGYPCQLVLPGAGAGIWVKRPESLEFRTLPTPTAANKADGSSIEGHTNKVNACIFDHYQGEFFPYGEEITLNGYAWAYHDPIVAVEFSLDRGKTWTRYETPDMDYRNWVYWTYTFKPATVGDYVLRVRGITEGGLETEMPGEMFFHVE